MSLTTNLRWAREQRTGDWVAKAVLMVIASHTDREGVAMLAYRTIADEVECNESTVRRHVPILVAAGLIEQHVGKGRGKTWYRLLVGRVVRPPGAAQPNLGNAAPTAAQGDLFSAAPESRTSDASDGPAGDRSAAQGTRSAAQQVSDQHEQTTEVEAEVTTRGAPPSPPAGADARMRASAREGSGERPDVVELNRTASAPGAAPGATRILNDWISGRGRTIRSSTRRELRKAIEQVMRQGVPADLIPEALDQAHDDPNVRDPAASLGWVCDRVERARHHARAPTTTALATFQPTARIPTTTQRVQAARALLDPEEP